MYSTQHSVAVQHSVGTDEILAIFPYFHIVKMLRPRKKLSNSEIAETERQVFLFAMVFLWEIIEKLLNIN